MILYLGKTDVGQLYVECSTTIVGCENCFVLVHKSDDITEGSKTIGKYKTLEEVREAANDYLEKEIPF